jgi:hypothetical protein
LCGHIKKNKKEKIIGIDKGKNELVRREAKKKNTLTLGTHTYMLMIPLTLLKSPAIGVTIDIQVIVV